MSIRDGILHSGIGRRVAELRKRKGLSQSELASRLARKRTQAWMSTVESGSRNMNTEDLVDVATILEVAVGELFNDVSTSSARVPKSVREFLAELDTHLPVEMPVYLQRDMAKSPPAPIDYQYASSAPDNKIFGKYHPLANVGSMSVMVVEKYYDSPKLDPTDLITFTRTLVPVHDPHHRATDRVLIKLNEPYDGLHVHPGLIKAGGEVETMISGRDQVVFEGHEFGILGVLIMRRTLYRASTLRNWIQRQYGISKEERMV